jgi:hypothetical protein
METLCILFTTGRKKDSCFKWLLISCFSQYQCRVWRINTSPKLLLTSWVFILTEFNKLLSTEFNWCRRWQHVCYHVKRNTAQRQNTCGEHTTQHFIFVSSLSTSWDFRFSNNEVSVSNITTQRPGFVCAMTHLCQGHEYLPYPLVTNI